MKETLEEREQPRISESKVPISIKQKLIQGGEIQATIRTHLPYTPVNRIQTVIFLYHDKFDLVRTNTIKSMHFSNTGHILD